MQHRGEIIKNAVYQSGYSITALTKKLGKSRRWMYLLFENANVSIATIIEIGDIIHYDFSKDIKDLKRPSHVLQESNLIYQYPEDSVAYWKDKYLKLLEEYNQLLKKI